MFLKSNWNHLSLNSYLTKTLHRNLQIKSMTTGNLNRLATAKSPYLRQHATNPVDWYPFEKQALDKAKTENKVRLAAH